MSSLVERLRARSEKRPRYDLEDSDDDFDAPRGVGKGGGSGGRGGGRRDEPAALPAEPIVRPDTKENMCQICGEGENLFSCETCTYAFHKKCLNPCLPTLSRNKWSCPECVSPLTELDRILDCEMRPSEEDGLSSSQPGQKPKLENQYLVKWKGLSYIHCSWISEKEFLNACKNYPRLKTRLNHFHKQMATVDKSDDDWVAIRPEWTTVDRILSSRKDDDGEETEYFVKWKELAYDESSWESKSKICAFQPQIERFKMFQARRKKRVALKRENLTREMRAYDESPQFLSGGTLHPYQLEGLNFLRFSWANDRRVILADEMGLGKTIQSIAFVASLFEDNHFPFLVVAPLSTLRNWEREFATWAPQMNVVMYFGSSQAREVIRKYEFYYAKGKGRKLKKRKFPESWKEDKQSRIKFDVLLTSYEMINMDSSVLKPIQWECMIVDEGHRLKNKDSKLFGQLKDYVTQHRVLLTGTPIQNNLDELFMLMHFLEGETFGSISDLQEEFKDINQDKQIEKLHGMLKPHLLRRFKKDVMKDLPPKKELILRVELTSKQKEYYRAILTRNYEVLARRGGAQISLINVVMELRKLCCHAFMLEGVEPMTDPANSEEGLSRLRDASGKMQLLDKMMVSLKEQGHRVLIYSQFQHMLDLLEDYLTFKRWTYERIDGKIGGAERQIRIDRFNAKNSNRFCFLLSTRAGGLGINLATADTVIIYDSDWNPHADLQAMARAHRLGQTSKVMIYRLVCRGTIEERMMQLTKKKMILEHIVVGKLKQSTVNQEELDDIIRYGSKELFADEDDEAGKARQIHYDDAAIERLLDREQVSDDEALEDDDDNEFLKGFKVADFEYIDEAKAAAAKEESRKQLASNSERANYWDDLLKDRYEVQKVEEHTTMGKGKRSRKQMNAADDDDHDASSEDEDYCCEDDVSDADPNAQGNVPGRRGPYSKKRSRNVEAIPLMEGEGKSFRVYGFNQLQRAAFAQALMRFGFQDYKWKEFLPRLKSKSFEEIEKYGALVMNHLIEEPNDSPNFSDGVPKEGLNVDDVLVRLANISLIGEKVAFILKDTGAPLFPGRIVSEFPFLKNGKFWKAEQDAALLKALLRHGYARWQAIVEDKSNGLAEVARQELNLPAVNEALGASQTSNGSNGNSDGAKVSADYTYQFRDVHRRIVEYIRKRYHGLEKALDLEYAARQSNIPLDDDVAEIPEDSKVVTNGSSSLLKDLPPVEPISNDEPASDNSSGHSEVRRLYNRICKEVEASATVALQTHKGDKTAASSLTDSLHKIETACEDVGHILAAGQHPT